VTSAVAARDLWQSVYDQLRAWIVAGDLEPGSRLVETELAERFETSRGPVRTALKELERDGLVVVNPRRGTFVSPISAEDIDEIFTLFEVLWPLAAHWAVARMTPESRGRLREQLGVIEATRSQTATEWTAANLAFHRMIFEISGHRRALQIWDGLDAQVRLYAGVLADADPGDLRATIRMHEAIYQALERDDAETATEAVRSYIRQLRSSLHLRAH
jgi:DNA-binding GntR family transcriptional regulator